MIGEIKLEVELIEFDDEKIIENRGCYCKLDEDYFNIVMDYNAEIKEKDDEGDEEIYTSSVYNNCLYKRSDITGVCLVFNMHHSFWEIHIERSSDSLKLYYHTRKKAKMIVDIFSDYMKGTSIKKIKTLYKLQ